MSHFAERKGILSRSERQHSGSETLPRGWAACPEEKGRLCWKPFTSFDWWRTEPYDELVDGGSFCLAEPGRLYAVYLPMGRKVQVQLAQGTYGARWYNPRDGKTVPLPEAKVDQGQAWVSPEPPDHGDWALLIRNK